MLRTSGRRVDLSQPFVDAMMPDGSRLHVVIPDITRTHLAVNIRKYILQAYSLDELIDPRSITLAAARLLEAAVAAGLNIVVSGEPRPGRPLSSYDYGDVAKELATRQVRTQRRPALCRERGAGLPCI